jgi:pimeloyl-ACP methyl ester carboxylesterase
MMLQLLHLQQMQFQLLCRVWFRMPALVMVVARERSVRDQNQKGEECNMATYVLVHGAWHTGAELEPTAAPIRAAGHEVHTPTIAGNKPGDAKTVGLQEAIKSIVDYLTQKNLNDVVLVGHSYGGMVITGVADQVPDRIRRLVYWNAFVPNNGESLNDLIPPHYVALFDQVAAERGDSSVVLPFPIWREAFINDADATTAKKVYDILNPHPIRTFSDKISLKTNPAAMQIGKSYVNCTEDASLPHSYPWHPRLSEKLGLFRLVQVPGSHELCFTNPKLLAQAIMDAGRD